MRMQVIGRSSGRSATAAAAYQSGEQVKDERMGQTFDYTGKSDIYKKKSSCLRLPLNGWATARRCGTK